MSQLRVADILKLEEEEEESEGDLIVMAKRDDGCRSFECMTPRVIISRWLKRLKEKGGRKRREKLGGGETDTKCSSGETAIDDGSNRDCEVGEEESGEFRKDPSFNLGVGFGLAFFVAASKNELDKMTELRTQMEILLKNVKGELQKKEALSKPCQSSSNHAYSTTDVEESWNSNAHVSLQNYTPPESVPCLETVVVHDQTLSYGRAEGNKFLMQGMNQLEAELEAELQRLELHLDTEGSLEHPQQQTVLEVREDTATGGSTSSSPGEVFEPNGDGFSGEQNGVSPNELARRLHELLESRQEERIKELETALECAKHKLREKEIEVSWWKDTAQLISQHVPRTPRLITQHSADAFRMMR